jgi:hypothetical protein
VFLCIVYDENKFKKYHLRNGFLCENVRSWNPGSPSSSSSQCCIFSHVVSVPPTSLSTIWKSPCFNPSCYFIQRVSYGIYWTVSRGFILSNCHQYSLKVPLL